MEQAWRAPPGAASGPARGIDLLAAIVVDPQARAVEVLGRAGIDAGALFTRIDRRLPRSV